MSWLFSSGDQNTGASDSASVLPIFRIDFFKIDWFDLTVQGTLRSLFQHHSLKASVLQHSAFFTIQLSQRYVTTRKTVALTIQTFVGRVMSLLFNTLPRLIIAFLPRSKQASDFMAAVTIYSDFKTQEEEIGHYFHLSPLYLP